MIRVNKLKGLMTEHGYSQTQISKELGITPVTFRKRIKKGVFGSDEIEMLCKLLKIEDPATIFFANDVT